MSRIKPPEFLSDVYRDLRDRHLLLPALALLVAVIAVPILLKSSDAVVAPPAAPVPANGKSSSLTAAVLADDSVSVRNYRKRLEQLKSKNPFKPQFELPVEASPEADAGAGAGSGGVVTDGSALGSTDEIATGGSTAVNASTENGDVEVDETNTTTVEETGGTGENGGGANQPSGHDVEVVEHLVTRRIDLTIGLVGDPKLRENVKPMTILPDAATPVLAFLGTDEQGLRAAFVLSKDATVVDGDAACVPTPENCLYITLEKNETATLAYGVDGRTFNLRLLAIEDHAVDAE